MTRRTPEQQLSDLQHKIERNNARTKATEHAKAILVLLREKDYAAASTQLDALAEQVAWLGKDKSNG